MRRATRPRIDLSGLRFSHDEELAARITDAFGYPALGDIQDSDQMIEMRERQLLGDSIKITRALLPDVVLSFERCLEALELDPDKGSLYVQQCADYNANVLAKGDRFSMVLNSGIINDFSVPEIRFVIGHELGHVLYKHSDISVPGLLRQHHDLAFEDARLLFRWSQSAEISADRVGLLCSGSLEGSVGSLFKVSSGLDGMPIDAIFSCLQSQYDDLKSHIESVETRAEMLRTHPMSPIRFKALQIAAKHFEINYGAGSSEATSDRSLGELDKELYTLFDALESQSVGGSGFRTREGQKQLFLILLYAMLADGALQARHQDALIQVARALDSEIRVQAMMNTISRERRAFRDEVPDRFHPAKEGDPLDQRELGCAVALALVLVSEWGVGEMQQPFSVAIRDLTRLFQLRELRIPTTIENVRVSDEDIREILGLRTAKI